MAETNYILASMAPRSDPMGNFVAMSNAMQSRALAPYQIAAAQQGQPLTAQQIEAARLANQERQLQLQDQQAVTEYYRNPGQFNQNSDAESETEPTGAPERVPPSTAAPIGAAMGQPAMNPAAPAVAPPTVNSRKANFAIDVLGYDPSDPLAKMANGLVRAGVRPNSVMEMMKGFMTSRAEYLKQSADQQALHDKSLADFNKIMTPIAAEKDLAKRSQMLADAMPMLQKSARHDPELQQMYQGLHESPEHLDSAINAMGVLEDSHKYAKEQAEETGAEQKIIPPGQTMSPEAQQQLAREIALSTNPQVQAGKEAVAAAEGRARANIETQMARGSNAALANVPQHLVAPATEAATKAGADYAQAQSVTERLQAMMDDAKKGNVVAYQLLPQEGALQLTTSQGVHRINMAEIQNYGGGSLWQKMQGHFGKALTGKSIPDSVLNDMAEMQKVQEEGARSKYENSLKNINQNYGSDFKPVGMESARPNTPQKIQYTAGMIRNGYKLKGGDPTKKENWEKQ
jgi:hypothetical protein